MSTKEKKKIKNIPTPRQECLRKEILENPRRPMSEIMKAAGYSENTIIHPKDVTSTEYYASVIQELRESFQQAGFTPPAFAQNITRIAFTSQKQNQYTGEVTSDDGKQLDGMKYGAEVLGWTKNSSDANIQVNIQPILGSISVQGNNSHQQTAEA